MVSVAVFEEFCVEDNEIRRALSGDAVGPGDAVVVFIVSSKERLRNDIGGGGGGAAPSSMADVMREERFEGDVRRVGLSQKLDKRGSVLSCVPKVEASVVMLGMDECRFRDLLPRLPLCAVFGVPSVESQDKPEIFRCINFLRGERVVRRLLGLPVPSCR